MIILKKIVKFEGILLAMLWVLFLLGITGKIYAWDLELTTAVPLNIELEIIIYGEGTVRIGDEVIASSSTITIKRNIKTEMTLIPSSGYKIDSIILNDEDISVNVHENGLVLPKLYRRSILEISFYEKALTPSTGENLENLLLSYLFITTSILVSILLLLRRTIRAMK